MKHGLDELVYTKPLQGLRRRERVERKIKRLTLFRGLIFSPPVQSDGT